MNYRRQRIERLAAMPKVISFPKQDAFVEDVNQFIAAVCTRRAGKTNALAKRFKRTMDKYPGSLSRYIALTRDSAKDIMWPVLQEMNDVHNWGCAFLDGPLVMKSPNGARLRLYGADMKNFIRRLRGAKSPAVAVDESQEFDPDTLENLVDNILTPTIADYSESWLALTGTPGPIPRGPFYEITEMNAGDYSVHKWSIYENPYLPNAAEFVERLKAKKKWTDLNPTYLREWQGKWVRDLDALLIRYDEEKNHFDSLPSISWNYILGVDIGLRDSDALAVIAWSHLTPDIYLVEEKITAGQDITLLTNTIIEFMSRYSFQKIVMDTGGLGAKIAEELRRRKGIPIHAADKKRKMENVAFMNESLRLGHFKAHKDSRFAKDAQQVQVDWDKSTPDKLVVKAGFHSDIIDATLYPFKEARTYLNEYKAPLPKKGTPERGEIESERFWEEQEALILGKKHKPAWERDPF